MRSAPSERVGRGRRPAAEVRAAALGTAADLLFHEGIAAVTHERVSALAGVSKTTLYKWWPSAGAIAADAYFHRSAPDLEMPYTGDIESDLKTQLRHFVDLLTRTDAGRAIRGLIAAAQWDDAVREGFAERYVRPRRAYGAAVLEEARQRGELRVDVDSQVLIDQLWGACYYRLLTEVDPVTPEYTDRLVDQALRGAAVRSVPKVEN
jgi:AcrR family transcriptional regulator